MSKVAMCVAFLFSLSLKISAQDRPCKILAPDRPSVGVALEGGVALGLAHVGVLEWLEENKIPVDCIAGTSMGALVGALYSIGYSPTSGPRDMLKFLKEADWDGIMADRIDYRDVTMMRKQDLRSFPSSLEFRFDSGFRLPQGMNAGHRVGLVFDQLTWPFYRNNELPVPFRCVATDVSSGASDILGEPVRQSKASPDFVLSEALRSTMSLPGLFYPVRMNGKTYVDGGLLQNLPVQALESMGADIIITVHLDHSTPSSRADWSVAGLVSESLSVITTANEKSGLGLLKDSPGSGNNCQLQEPPPTCDASKNKPCHLPLTIRVNKFGSLEFEEWQKLREQGYQEAQVSFKDWSKNNSGCVKTKGDRLSELFDLTIDENYVKYQNQRQYPAQSVVPQYVTIAIVAPAQGKSSSSSTSSASLESLVASSLSCNRISGSAEVHKYQCPKYVPTANNDQTGCKRELQPAGIAAGKASVPGLPGIRNANLTESRETDPFVEQVPAFYSCHAQRLETQLNRMVGSGRFARLGYHMRTEPRESSTANTNASLADPGTDSPYLEIVGDARESSPILVRPVLAVDGSDYTNPIFAVGARFTAFDVGPMGSEVRGEAFLGSRYGLSTEYYQPIFGSVSNWFVAPRATAESSPFNIYHDQDQLAHYQLRTISGALDVGYNFGRNAQLRLGYEGGGIKFSRLLGSEIFPFTADRVGTTSLRISFDHLKFPLRKFEAPSIPREGVIFNSSFQWHDGWLGATKHFPTAALDIGLFKSISKSGTVYLKGDGGSSLGFINNGLPSFSLGGAPRLAAYGTNELLTNQYFHGATGYIHRVLRFQSLGGGVYAVGYVELAKAYGLPAAPTLPKDATAGMILDSILGPLFVGGSAGDAGHRKFFFYMGKLF